jgi:hypothetical protein
MENLEKKTIILFLEFIKPSLKTNKAIQVNLKHHCFGFLKELN